MTSVTSGWWYVGQLQPQFGFETTSLPSCRAAVAWYCAPAVLPSSAQAYPAIVICS